MGRYNSYINLLFQKSPSVKQSLKFYTLLLLIPLFILGVRNNAVAQTDTVTKSGTLVYKFKIGEDIMPAAWRTTKRAMEEAKELDADVILLVLNTYGGMVNMADSIRTKLLTSHATTIVYIENNAASAGALISLACDSIYMSSFAKIGAATVVDQTGEKAPDKYQSYFRKVMATTAESKGITHVKVGDRLIPYFTRDYQMLRDSIVRVAGDTFDLKNGKAKLIYKRDPDIAKGMVDEDIYIPGITEVGKIITFTAQEALNFGYCDGIVGSPEEALEAAGIKEYEIREYKKTALDKIIGWLSNPAVSSILILIMIGGIYFELQTPGVGFPIIASGVAAILYFAPNYLDGLAANWEILLFIAGLGLVALEIFVIPGFGVAGIAGIILIIASLTLSAVANDAFDFSMTGTGTVARVFVRVVVTVTVAIGLMIVLGSRFFKSNRVLKRVALMKEQLNTDGYTARIYKEDENLEGAEGTAITDLHPAGKVGIGDERYDAMSEGGFIGKGENIIVVEVRNNHLLVRKKK